MRVVWLKKILLLCACFCIVLIEVPQALSTELTLELGALEEQLAEKFAPVLHMHPLDRQEGLADFTDVILNHCRLKAYNDIGQKAYDSRTPPIHVYQDWAWCSCGRGSLGRYWKLDIDDDVRYKGATLGNRPLYYHVYACPDYYYIQYWYFFTMNDLNGQIENNTWHEGDWEHIAIRINKDGPPYFPVVNFYQHYGGHTVDGSNVWWSENYGVDYGSLQRGYDEQHTHPHVWIARNSHASYNRYDDTYVIDVTGGTHYEDEVSYTRLDLLFGYDKLINMGEVCHSPKKDGWDYAHGYKWFEHYEHHPVQGSPDLEALAFIGRIGEYWVSGWSSVVPPTCDAPVTPSPRSPAFHDEWTSFTIAPAGFGNTGSSCSFFFKGIVSWKPWASDGMFSTAQNTGFESVTGSDIDHWYSFGAGSFDFSPMHIEGTKSAHFSRPSTQTGSYSGFYQRYIQVQPDSTYYMGV